MKYARFISIFVIGLFPFYHLFGQLNTISNGDSWKNTYRATAEKINDLVHTKLEVRFDFEKSYLYGKEWVQLKPHFYQTDTVRLDAKGMEIKRLGLFKKGAVVDLSYKYENNSQLVIQLDKTYQGGELYTLYLEYVSKPNEIKAVGSAAITDAKGLYFINPQGKEKNKPTEVWTQGETEASSAWFPTIDKPNQKTTSEISMTVPSKYVTLSNGRLATQKKNLDGTRTDTWEMTLPHSPYLFFMGVGDFAIVKDSYKGKEVSYYVERPFESVARGIFGLTPEMMAFYSSRLGVEYPWNKYSQMVGRDYVSGAMENTSATLHSEYLQQNARELVDGNKYEDYVSHELFHQWFGDLVTAESWSNLTVNESFANFSETLWNEFKHGQDAGDAHNYQQMLEYLESGGEKKSLVRFQYRDKEDVFDRVTYHKGGRILNMLRNLVGEKAFFKSLNLYLNTYKFKNAEADQLRLAFEEVTGKDLTWFWNQWYYGSGHPRLDIQYSYDSSNKKALVFVTQTQTEPAIFKFPVTVDVYSQESKMSYKVWVTNKTDTFGFAAESRPTLVNFDADKILLAQKKENKTIDEYIFQYSHAKKYVDRREAIDFAILHKEQKSAATFLATALHDDYYELRERILKNLTLQYVDAATLKTIEKIAKNDSSRKVRANAIDLLAGTNDTAYTDLFIRGTTDSSYSVAGASLSALAIIDPVKAITMAAAVKNDAKGRLQAALREVDALTKTDNDFQEMTAQFDQAPLRQKIEDYKRYINFLENVSATANFKKGIDKVIAFRNQVSKYYPEVGSAVNQRLEALKLNKVKNGLTVNLSETREQVGYLESKLK